MTDTDAPRGSAPGPAAPILSASSPAGSSQRGGAELGADAADSQNAWVLRQVSNGVAVRMAVLYLLLTDGSSEKLYSGDES